MYLSKILFQSPEESHCQLDDHHDLMFLEVFKEVKGYMAVMSSLQFALIGPSLCLLMPSESIIYCFEVTVVSLHYQMFTRYTIVSDIM